MKTIIYHIRVALKMLQINILSGLEYPVFFLGFCLSNPIQFIVGFATIKFVVEQFESVNGWGFEEMAFLYGIAVISHALCMMTFFQCWLFGNMLIQGEFDRFMLRPMNVLFQFMTYFFNICGFSDLIPGIIVFIYGCIKVNFVWNFSNILAVLGTIIGATLIRGSVMMVICTTAFWTKSTNDYGAITQELFDKTTQYPISIYPKGLQFLFTFILPLAWISFYPAGELLSKDIGLQLPVSMGLMTFFIGIVSFIVAGTFFMYGSKKYESAGN